MTTASAAMGTQKKAGMSPYNATRTIMPLRITAAGVRTPDLDLRAEREKELEPVAG
jgi:hypothetical protein